MNYWVGINKDGQLRTNYKPQDGTIVKMDILSIIPNINRVSVNFSIKGYMEGYNWDIQLIAQYLTEDEVSVIEAMEKI